MARLTCPDQPEEDLYDWSNYPFLTQTGVNLIKRYTTPRVLKGSGRFGVYRDPMDAKSWCIGYGSKKIRGRTLGAVTTATKKEIDEQLILDLKNLATQIQPYVLVRTNSNKRSALLSFAHSVGVISFKNSRLLELINNVSPKKEIIHEWSPYINTIWRSGGETMIDRRRTELDLYLAADKEIPTLAYHNCQSSYCLLNLAETFNGAAHQIKAIEYLERKISEWDPSGNGLKRFFHLWSQKPAGLSSPPRRLNSSLDDQ